MKKKFFLNLLFLVALNLIVKPFWVLGIDRVVQNQVGSADYGMYFSLFNLSLLFNIILDLGLTNFNNRNIAQHKQLLPKYFSNIVVLKFLLAFFYAIITLAVGFISGYDIIQFKILLILIFNQFLLSFILYLRSNISGLHHFKIDSLISVLDRVLMIILIAILLWTNIVKGDFQIIWFVYAQTIAYFITALIAFFVVLSYSKSIKIKINKAFLVSTLKQTFPYALLVFFMSFYNRFDAFIIERLLVDGKTQAGIYAQSFRLLDAVSQFSLLFAALLLPIFSRMLKTKQKIDDLVQFSFFLLLTPSVIFVVSSVFYSTEIIDLLYTEHAEISSSIFSILIIAFIPISLTYIFGTLLTANGNLKKLNIIAFLGVVINLTLNLILIPQFKAYGAAITAIITQVLTAVLQMWLAFYIFKIKISTKKIISIMLFLAIFIPGVYLTHKSINNWIIGFSTSLLIGLVFGFLFNLINLKTLVRLFKGYED
ncbi:MAG: polysaccharide biosynthesis C-terminal domain-containing protein [Bacteroidales bacterium]|nr:polysaccharide biosynthesis C-terminal domain-containing protein [Bacteroidales bacterium]